MARIKICGITNYNDSMTAIDLGAHYLGFNFFKKSPRFVNIEYIKKVIEKLPPIVKSVGIFVNEDLEKIKETVNYCNLDIIQLSGDESTDFVSRLKKTTDKVIIKSIRVQSFEDLIQINSLKSDYVLLDSFKEGSYGGTGQKIDFKILKRINADNLFLAGGLTKSNVKNAVDLVNPYAVDVCSGIEKMPGQKDYKKMKEFIEIIK